MADRFIQLETRVRVPSAALVMIDDFSDALIAGSIKFLVDDQSASPILNRSGYFVFFGLSPGVHNVRVRAEGFQEEVMTAVVRADQKAEIRAIRLRPLPSYPFPNGTTILRGEVFETGTELPLAEVAVSLAIRGKELSTVTTLKGEFVIYLARLTDSASKKVNGKVFVRGGEDGVELSPRFVKPGHEDGELFLNQEGTREKVDSMRMEVGKELRIRKYLTRGG